MIEFKPMDDKRFQELSEKYPIMFDGPVTPERREVMMERARRKYEEEMARKAEQKPAS
jgi:hypothetical protein